MMRQRTFWLLGLVLVLGIGWWVLQATASDPKMTRLTAERNFKVDDVTQIGKIFIADRKGLTVNLKRVGQAWVVNDQYPVGETSIKNLLNAIGQLEMAFIPSNGIVPTIVKTIATSGLHIEVFDHSGAKLTGYYLGGVTQDERGVFAMKEEADQPYVVHIPGWSGNLLLRYNLTVDQWRSRQLLAEKKENLVLVSIEYPSQRNESFVLERQEGEQFSIGPFYETGQARREVPPLRTAQYFAVMADLHLSDFANYATSEKAELLQRQPFAILRIKRRDGSESTIKIYPRYNPAYEALDPNSDAAVAAYTERGFNLLINKDQDFVTASQQAIQPLLVSYDYF